MAVSKGVMSTIVVVVAIVAFAAGLLVGPYVMPEETPETIWDTIQERGEIRVGSSPDWPPYEYLNITTGEFTGFEVELMEMIAERLDLEVEWKEMGFDLIIPDVRDKAIDMGVSGFSVKPERLEIVQFTMHHSVTEGQIIMLNSTREALGITEIDSLAELSDLELTCGVQIGTTQQEELQSEASDALVTYEDYIAALEELKRTPPGIDCIYAETPVTSWWMLEAEEAGEEPLVVIYTRPYWPVAFVAHRDADILVEKINGVLAEIISQGELDELKAKWKA